MAQRVQLKATITPQPVCRVVLKKPIDLFQWGGPFEGWARRYVSRNFWRVRELFGSEEDALQECALIFVRCCRTYQSRVDNPAWMMSLFQRSVINDWNTFAQRDGRLRSLPLPEPEEEVDQNNGPFVTALNAASDELKLVITTVLNAPSEFVDMLFRGVEYTRSVDPTTASIAATTINRRIRRLLGISKTDVDIIGELRSILE